MSERVAMVTGASRGIGLAITKRLLAEGWRVVGLARSPASMHLQHERYTAVSVDLTELATLPKVLSGVISEHPAIDALVSVAGRGVFGELEQHSVMEIQQSLTLNLLSHMAMARIIVPHLKTLQRGDIVFMGSEAALRGTRQGTLYCAAKFGLRGFAQALRAECARRGVRVGIVNPGMVRTPFFEDLEFRPGPDASHAIEPADVAEAVWMIVSARHCCG